MVPKIYTEGGGLSLSTYDYILAKIRKAEDGDESITQERMEELIYRRYTENRLTPEEYNELCCICDGVFAC